MKPHVVTDLYTGRGAGSEISAWIPLDSCERGFSMKTWGASLQRGQRLFHVYTGGVQDEYDLRLNFSELRHSRRTSLAQFFAHCFSARNWYRKTRAAVRPAPSDSRVAAANRSRTDH